MARTRQQPNRRCGGNGCENLNVNEIRCSVCEFSCAEKQNLCKRNKIILYSAKKTMKRTSMLRYLLVLLIAAIVLPQAAYSQEDTEEFVDANQAEIDSILNLITPATSDKEKAGYYYEVAYISSNIDTVLKYSFLGLDICNDTLLIAYFNRFIGWGYYLNNQSVLALPYVQKSKDLFSKINRLELAGHNYMLLARIYEDLNKPDSIKYYIGLALDYEIKQNDTSQISDCYKVLGGIYSNKSLYKESEQYYWKAIELDSLIGNKLEMAISYFRLGELYCDKSNERADNYLAKKYLAKAVRLQVSENSKDEYYLSIKYLTYSQIADVYINIAENTNNNVYADSCLYFIKISLDYFIKQGRTENAVDGGYTYVEYLKYYKKYNEALAFLQRQKKYFDDNSSPQSLSEYYGYLKEIYCCLGDYKNAYSCIEKEYKYERLNLNDSTMSALSDIKTQQAVLIERMDREKAEAILVADKRRMKVVIASLIGGLIMVLTVIALVVRVLIIKRRANSELLQKNAILSEQKEEIRAQRDEIEEQRDEIIAQRDHIEAQNCEIQASINYAQRIQSSLLTPEDTIASIFPDHFLLYKPRDIVSGDFYWVGQFGDNKVCIVADCTGHGVPGGFMSMLGMTNLNYIVGQEVEPGAILDKLRNAVISNLRQKRSEENNPQVLDGMDVAAYVVNEKKMTLTYAGANNPLVLIRGNVVRVLKADRMPVGISMVSAPFKSVTTELQKGDCIYTYSDGFQDQFGNASDRKFQKSRFRDLLLEIHQRPMAEQRELLNTIFEEWRGPAENQTDDVVIMGVRI